MKNETLHVDTEKLKFYGLLAHWDEVAQAPWLPNVLMWEENARTERSLKRRLDNAHLGHFKPLGEFNWEWPTRCDRRLFMSCFELDFVETATNIIFCGPNGVGKTMLASNLGYEAVLKGHTCLFTTAGCMLNELAAQDGDNALRRRLNYFVKPSILIVDEVGYLSYSNRHADLFFEIISRRYEKKPTIITTNKPFSEWSEIFPNASCVVSLIDRLVHHSEIITIEAKSFRLKESQEKREQRKMKRNETLSGSKNNVKEKENKRQSLPAKITDEG